ncbi:MAG: RNA 2',3'-cyclic phosphodiesterase [bacterium]
MIRAFIAIPFEDNIKSEVLKIIDSLRSSVDGNVKWVARDNIHLTLKFLGNIDDQQIKLVKDTMDGLKDIKAFKIDLCQIGGFPHILKPRVIWIGVKQQEQIKLLFDRIEARISDINREDRAFSAHITIGRVKNNINGNKLEKIKKLWDDKIICSSIVKRIVLFQSILSPKGAVYQPIYHVDLKKEV